MRLGPIEVLMMLLVLAGLAWVVYQLTRKPPATHWEAQKRDLQDLRRRLAELQAPCADSNAQSTRGTN